MRLDLIHGFLIPLNWRFLLYISWYNKFRVGFFNHGFIKQILLYYSISQTLRNIVIRIIIIVKLYASFVIRLTTDPFFYGCLTSFTER